MVRAYKLHKIAGISAGVFLIILSISGFFLDHDKWGFLYTTTFSSVPSQTLPKQNRLYTSYYKDLNNPNHIVVGSHRGLFESFDAGKDFVTVASFQVLAIKAYANQLYVATSNGIYTYNNKKLEQIALDGAYITAMSISKNSIVAVVDKEKLVTIDKETHKVLHVTQVSIDKELLKEDIKLSRFVRDLHYGRGVFDGDLSLLINDYGAVMLSFLAVSGFVIWFFIKRKIYPKLVRKLIRMHASLFAIMAVFPFVILAVSGIFLDHASFLARFMKSVTIPHAVLPPVYDRLKSDIWSVDYDGKVYRVGNRYGIYTSKDLQKWSLENRGFAYKMIRKGEKLYISGMGAPNRVLENGKYRILDKSPHMFRDIVIDNGNVLYLSMQNIADFHVPTFENITLYTLLLTLHDGSFFSSWWIWVNDFAAVMLFILCLSGIIRWRSLYKS